MTDDNGAQRGAVIEPEDRVLLRKIGKCIQRKYTLADLWEAEPYLILSQSIPDMFRVEKDNSTGKFKLLHMNIVLPFPRC